MSKFIDWLDEWESVELSSVADVIDPHPSHRAPEEYQLGIPFAGIGDLDENGNLKNNGVRKVKADIFEEHIKRYKITSNTIGFGRVASIGKIIDFKGFSNKVTISPTIAVVEPKNIEKKFLVNTLKSKATKQQIDLLLTGSTRSSLGIALLRELILPLPPFPEQQKIAKILTSVDEVIEKTQAQIDKLKDLKTGMMQELLTNGIGHTEFKDSPVSRIPAQWEVVTFSSVLKKIDSGWSPSCTEIPPSTGKWGVLKVSAVTRGEFLEIKSKKLPATLEPRHHIQVRKGDILLTRANGVADLVGKCVMVREEPKRKLMMSDKILRLNPNEDIDAEFLLHSFNSQQTRKQIELSWGGSSGQKNISQADIKLYKLALPPIEEQKKISQSISQVEHALKAKDKKLCSLLGVKKALMQDLLTGKVRVKVDS